MFMCFDLYTIKGNMYKRLIQCLCQVSDRIYFTCDREYTIDKGIYEVEDGCERADVPLEIRNWCNGDTIGYKINAHLIQYLYAYNNVNHLLGDRMSRENKTIFFYNGVKQVAHIYNTTSKVIYIETNEERIIRDILPLR